MWPAISKRCVLGFLYYLMSIPIERSHPQFVYLVAPRCRVASSLWSGPQRLPLLLSVCKVTPFFWFIKGLCVKFV